MLTRKLTFFAVAVLLVGSLWLATSSAAPASQDQHYGPFASVTTDGGSCGHDWAVDTVDRVFNVHDNRNGTFAVDEQFKNGSFVTLAGPSPSACAGSDFKHGSLVNAGITGTFVGYFDFTVSGGVYNPSGCSLNPAACTTTAGFIGATFPGGSLTCPGGVCKFGFEYASGDNSLAYHHWADVSDKNGNDLFRDDIANQ